MHITNGWYVGTGSNSKYQMGVMLLVTECICNGLTFSVNALHRTVKPEFHFRSCLQRHSQFKLFPVNATRKIG